jgi:carboxyl-terminal processing protease
MNLCPSVPSVAKKFPSLLYSFSVLWFAGLLALAGCATAPTVYRGPAPLAAAERTTRNLAVFDRVWELVNERYFDPKFRGVDWPAQRASFRPQAAEAPDDEALYRTINRMLATLKESHLFAAAPRLAHELRTDHRVAVGLRLQFVEGKRVVVETVPGSPAEAAGIRIGWIAVARNGAPFPAPTERDTFAARPGVPVSFTFLDESDQSREFALEPRLLSFKRREERALPGGAVYLRFDEFDFAALSWFSSRLKAHQDAPAVVLDLRSNPGGYTVALRVALGELFPGRVATGRTVSRQGRAREVRSQSWLSANYSGRVVVLTGPSTGSAAEILAHVLQHHRRATIVGRRTAGAVIYSRYFSLPGGGRLSVPVEDYVGLDGKRLEGRGVTPDVAVPVSLADLRAGRDDDLAAALALLEKPGT